MIYGDFSRTATNGFMMAAYSKARHIILDLVSGGVWNGLTENHFMNNLPCSLIFSIYLNRSLTACRVSGCDRVGM